MKRTRQSIITHKVDSIMARFFSVDCHEVVPTSRNDAIAESQVCLRL
ncbi:hypothetical protein [Helicobacter sp. MIT 05-5294]|nr:hypothetical protein [Helicobacter sp. MIT 05-5294]